jgi:hypothetical protein
MTTSIKNKIKTLIKYNIFYNISSHYTVKQIDVFRIAVSSFALLSIISLLMDYKLLFAPNSLINWEVSNASSFWFEVHPAKIAQWLSIEPNTVGISLILLYIAGLLFLLVGIWTRFAAILTLCCFVSLTTVISTYGYGVDVYQTVALFLLCLFPTGYTLSIMPKKEYKDLAEIRKISIRVLQLYLSLTYLSAGVEKGLMANWWNGKFIFFLVNDPTVVTWKIVPIDYPSYFYAILGIMVVFIESLYVFLVWIPKLRSILLLSIVFMHLFIGFVMGLHFFGLLLIILNIVCWYPAFIHDFKKIRKNDTKICVHDAYPHFDSLLINSEN